LGAALLDVPAEAVSQDLRPPAETRNEVLFESM
jgi:hypothetical protein